MRKYRNEAVVEKEAWEAALEKNVAELVPRKPDGKLYENKAEP